MFTGRGLEVRYLVDETLREGGERSAFPVSLAAKCSLLKSIADAGVRDFVVGGGPEVPLVWEALFEMREKGELPANTRATFIVLLNCWETAFANFSNGAYRPEWLSETIFSFGMLTFEEEKRTFERAIAAFRSLGATKFKVSVLNNFRCGFSEEKYVEIRRQVDWAVSQGVRMVRINDSLGALQPRGTTEMATRLVRDYPELTLCLHAHNDSGLAVANTLAAVECGFQMVEGSVGGIGNRSGIAALEQIVKLLHNNGINVGDEPIDLPKLIVAARKAEETFLIVPSAYRPVGGIFETNSNFGVLNIPDFLATGDKKEYFVNYAGLHPRTIRAALRLHAPAMAISATDEELWTVVMGLRQEMEGTYDASVSEYRKIMRAMRAFYDEGAYTTRRVADRAMHLLLQKRRALHRRNTSGRSSAQNRQESP